MTSVLVVDDEPQIVRALRINLSARGYDVMTAYDGKSALGVAVEGKPDVVVLDLGLPDIDGVDVIAGLRGWSTIPIIVLSARTDSSAKVEALDAGADDYVTKPFGMDELLARLRAAVRRNLAREAGDPVVETSSFVVDLAVKKVRRDGREVHLTPTEWGLVEILARNPGRLRVAETAAAGGVGADARQRVPVPARLLRPVAAQAGGRPGPSASPDHRARNGIPVRG